MEKRSRIKRYGFIALISMFVIVVFAGCGIYFFERNEQPEMFGSFLGTIWWSITSIPPADEPSISTVTTPGKILELVIAFASLVIVFTVAILLMYVIIETRFDIERLRKNMADDDK